VGVYRREGVLGIVDRVLGRLADYIPLLPIGGRSFEARFGPRLLRLLDATLGPPKIYCQKPWKDLHSYTVDGRMDVCCIATGPSQEAYALGNMFDQDFQEIWNGEAARRFRRTVNTDDKLLVCSRCTMANNYARPF